MSYNLHMQINGTPVPMNINLERQPESLKYTQNQQCGILQLLQSTWKMMALLYFEVPLLSAHFLSEPPKITRGS